MKKVFTILFALTICLLLISCSKKSDEKFATSEEETKISLVSGKDRIVYYLEDTYYVVYFKKDNKITDLKWIYDFNTTSEAINEYRNIQKKYSNDDEVYTVKLYGTQVIVEFKKSTIEDLNVSDVESLYTDYEIVK